jgi:hypothetical protein
MVGHLKNFSPNIAQKPNRIKNVELLPSAPLAQSIYVKA